MALAQRWQRSLSIRSRPPTRRACVDPLRTVAEVLIVRSRPRLRTHPQVTSCLRRVHHRDRRRRQIPIAPAARPVLKLPRLRALALFGRRSAKPAACLSAPASKNLHSSGSYKIDPRAHLLLRNDEGIARATSLHSGGVPRFLRGAVKRQISPVDPYDISTEPPKSSSRAREMSREPKPLLLGSDTGGPPSSCQTNTNCGLPA
jgi:hypothetical protein